MPTVPATEMPAPRQDPGLPAFPDILWRGPGPSGSAPLPNDKERRELLRRYRIALTEWSTTPLREKNAVQLVRLLRCAELLFLHNIWEADRHSEDFQAALRPGGWWEAAQTAIAVMVPIARVTSLARTGKAPVDTRILKEQLLRHPDGYFLRTKIAPMLRQLEGEARRDVLDFALRSHLYQAAGVFNMKEIPGEQRLLVLTSKLALISHEDIKALTLSERIQLVEHLSSHSGLLQTERLVSHVLQLISGVQPFSVFCRISHYAGLPEAEPLEYALAVMKAGFCTPLEEDRRRIPPADWVAIVKINAITSNRLGNSLTYEQRRNLKAAVREGLLGFTEVLAIAESAVAGNRVGFAVTLLEPVYQCVPPAMLLRLVASQFDRGVYKQAFERYCALEIEDAGATPISLNDIAEVLPELKTARRNAMVMLLIKSNVITVEEALPLLSTELARRKVMDIMMEPT